MTPGLPIRIYFLNDKSAFSLTRLAKKVTEEELDDLESFVNQAECELGGKRVRYAFNIATAISAVGLVGSIANYYGANISKDIVDGTHILGGLLSFTFGMMHLYGNIDPHYARKRIAERKNHKLNLPATQNHHPAYETNSNTHLSDE